MEMPAAVSVPLRLDEGGVLRIGNSRVTLQSVIADFHRGASAEEIAYHFPVLTLAEVYPVIAYYLQNRAEVNAYIERQRDLSQQARHDYETAASTDPL